MGIIAKLFMPRVKRIESSDDLRGVRIGNIVEIPYANAKGVVSNANQWEGAPAVTLVENRLIPGNSPLRDQEQLYYLTYIFKKKGIEYFNPQGIMCSDGDRKRYEPKLKRAGLIK